MPLSSSIAISLGFAAIGVNIILTSLVCHEISITWTDFDKEIQDSQVIHKHIRELLHTKEIGDRVSRQVVDNVAKESLRSARRRIFNRIRGVSNIDIEDDKEYDSSDGDSEKPSILCKCLAQNKCPPGPRGPRGRRGSKGLPGKEGNNGENGVPAVDEHQKFIPDCIICPPGPTGLPGEIGEPGPIGLVGPPGAFGTPGHHGLHGMPGDVGPQGPDGEVGLPGIEGEEGFPAEVISPTKGEKGQPGEPGEQGPQGDSGNPGPEGMLSIIRGRPGPSGTPGKPGNAGLTGPEGDPGQNGETVCECYVYVGENPPIPPEEDLQLSIAEAKRGEIRRSPFAEIKNFSNSKEQRVNQQEEMPSPSQIALEAAGEIVNPVKKRKLYTFNQSGLVNITHVKELQKEKKLETSSPLLVESSTVSQRENIPNLIHHYAYLKHPVPANSFSTRSKTYAAKTFKVEQAYAVEKDLSTLPKNFAMVDENVTKVRRVLLQDVATQVLKETAISKARRKQTEKKRKSKKSSTSRQKKIRRRHPQSKTQFGYPIVIKFNS